MLLLEYRCSRGMRPPPPFYVFPPPPRLTRPAGTVLEALLAWAVLPRLGWRWLLALSATPLLLLLLLYPMLPESPHWLVAKRRYAEAEALLQSVGITPDIAHGKHTMPACFCFLAFTLTYLP